MADWAGLENRCGSNITEGSNPSLSALQFDAGWCSQVQETPVFSGFLAFSSLLVSASICPFSVQSGASCDASDARRTAPFSAPLGTTVGTFSGPFVPVARSIPAPDSGASNVGIAGRDASADAWSWTVSDV